MPSVAHDFLVRHPVPIGGCHEPSAQAVGADRLRQGAFQSGPSGAFEQDLPRSVRHELRGFDRAAAVHLAGERPG